MSSKMDGAVQFVVDRNITNHLEILRILMERAEKLSDDGATKKRLVMDAYKQVLHAYSKRAAGPGLQRLGMIPLSTIEAIIEAITYFTKVSISINQTTGCWTKITSWCKKKSTGTTGADTTVPSPASVEGPSSST